MTFISMASFSTITKKILGLFSITCMEIIFGMLGDFSSDDALFTSFKTELIKCYCDVSMMTNENEKCPL